VRTAKDALTLLLGLVLTAGLYLAVIYYMVLQ